mmetsp:Transcript_7873/g.15237  ORF Transcript_7873/g.15237 Transcript_7873/m.15237 type:complete len:177 (-) Transcript_7873:7472-8002(-)
MLPVFPGDPVPDNGGLGTHLEASKVRATLAGTYDIASGVKTAKRAIMPKASQEVLGVVTRIRLQTASIQIVAVAGIALHGSFSGVIRLQDIRKHDIDKLQVTNCFKPGDIVKARVLSLGDSRAYFLSTAEAELGVVVAYAEDGTKLIPLNWEQMVDPNTGRKEPRKVARPLVLVKG